MTKQLKLIFKFDTPTLNNRIYHQENFINAIERKRNELLPGKIPIYLRWDDYNSFKNPIGFLNDYIIDNEGFFIGNCMIIESEENNIDRYNRLNVVLEGDVASTNEVNVFNFLNFSLTDNNGYNYGETYEV